MRLSFNIALVLSTLFLPWWITALILCVACFVVDRFFEAVLYGIAVDSLYGSRIGLYGFHFAGSALSVVVLAVALLLRKRLAW